VIQHLEWGVSGTQQYQNKLLDGWSWQQQQHHHHQQQQDLVVEMRIGTEKLAKENYPVALRGVALLRTEMRFESLTEACAGLSKNENLSDEDSCLRILTCRVSRYLY
jgi:hypothetical protein